MLTRPAATTPTDATAYVHEEAKQLSAQLKAAASSGNRDAAPRAH